MTDRLFVYGTLAPGRSNAHMLADVPGLWEPGMVRGTLFEQGWGAALGYPGMVPDERGEEVRGLVFRSEQLAAHWPRLDEFEGDGYERVLVAVTLGNGTSVNAYIYRLSENCIPRTPDDQPSAA